MSPRLEALEDRLVPTSFSFPMVNYTPFDDNQVHIALICQDYSGNGKYYYIDASGTKHETGTSGTVPTFTLDQLGGVDRKRTLTLPDDQFGYQAARLYFGLGNDLVCSINADGSVNYPVANNQNNPNWTTYFDFVEFSLDNPAQAGLNIDTTYVDQFGFPIKVQVDSTDPNNIKAGVGVEVVRQNMITDYQFYVEQTATELLPTFTMAPTTATNSPQRLIAPGSALQVALNAHFGLFNTLDSGQGISATDTQFDAWNAGNPYPGPFGPVLQQLPFLIRIDNEIMQVTSITTNPNTNQPTIWNVTRGFAGTTASAHSQGAYVLSYPELTSYLDAYVDYFFDSYFQSNAQLSLTVNDIAGVPANTVYTATGLTLNGSNYAFAFTSPNDPYGTTYYVYYPFFTDPFTGLGNYNPTYTPLLYPSSSPPNSPASIGDQFSGTFLPTPTGMVYGAYGAFNDSAYVAGFNSKQQKVLGSLENQISSALNRGVALLNSTQWHDSSQYYKTGPGNTIPVPGSAQVNYTNNWNRYSQFFHNQAGSTVTIDGRAYGFPYDDQAGQASDIAVQSFTSATITLGAWNAFESIGNSVLVTGTAGDDVMLIKALRQGGFQVQLNGTVLGTINGLAGQLIMHGLDGNDRLLVDQLFAYDAELRGGRGCDVLIGGRGNDRLFGGGGKDVLYGGSGRNRLDGGPGNDILIGRRHRDVFHGAIGHDRSIWLNTAAEPQSVFELARIAAKYFGRGERSDYHWPPA